MLLSRYKTIWLLVVVSFSFWYLFSSDDTKSPVQVTKNFHFEDELSDNNFMISRKYPLKPKPPRDDSHCMRYNFTETCNSDTDPFCQQHILEYMLVKVSEKLQRHNVTTWLAYGTLLGMIREHGIIPWTLDNDLGILDPGDPLLLTQQLKLVAIDLWNEDRLHMFNWTLERVCLSWEARPWSKIAEPAISAKKWDKFPYTDIYVFTKVRTALGYEKIHDKPNRDCLYPMSRVFPLDTFKWQIYTFNVPRNYTTYLMQLYGTTWTKPPPEGKRNPHGLRTFCREFGRKFPELRDV